jgi:hypothetical protein
MLPPNSLLDVETALRLADTLVAQQMGQHLTTLQSQILQSVWLGQTYEEISVAYHCSEPHIRRVGASLWQILSQATGEEVSKKNLRAALDRYYKQHQGAIDETAIVASSSLQENAGSHLSVSLLSAISQSKLPEVHSADLPFPEGQVELGSPFYIERPPLEAKCYQEVLRPGCLIRIKAPHQMGKTSLLVRLLHFAQQQQYHTVSLNLQLVDSKTLQNLDSFLQWFGAVVTHKLQLTLKLEHYWNDIFGSKTSCKDYFEQYLLAQITQPLVIALDNVDEILNYPEIADQFFSLLRAWFEEARNSEIWQRMRLVLVYATEDYISLNINHSPFNVGVPIELPNFNCEQIQLLADRHCLSWSTHQAEQLLIYTGGHPYLVRLALYHMACYQISLSNWLSLSPTEIEPFSNHLRKHLLVLEQQPELITALKSLLRSLNPVRLKQSELFKLSRMGLLRLQDNQATFSCDLYRQYFSNYL